MPLVAGGGVLIRAGVRGCRNLNGVNPSHQRF